jgi:hypothetical protein
MKLVNRYKSCVGITLLVWKNYLVELWICPAGETVPMHVHYCCNNTFFFFKGAATFVKVNKQMETLKRDYNSILGFMLHTINGPVPHSIENITRRLWFINITTMTNKQMISPSVNFHEV